MKIIKGLFSLIIIILFSLLIIIRINYKITEIRGFSMLPTLKNGETYLVVKETGNLVENEIYIYQTETELVCHRFIKQIDENTYLFKGDNNETYDRLVYKEQIKYKLLQKVNDKRWLQNRYFTILEIMFILSLIVLFGKEGIVDYEDELLYISSTRS